MSCPRPHPAPAPSPLTRRPRPPACLVMCLLFPKTLISSVLSHPGPPLPKPIALCVLSCLCSWVFFSPPLRCPLFGTPQPGVQSQHAALVHHRACDQSQHAVLVHHSRVSNNSTLRSCTTMPVTNHSTLCSCTTMPVTNHSTLCSCTTIR